MAELDLFFKPNSIAVIGASRSPDKIGYAIVRNIIDSGYKGEIYPINPKEEKILDLPVYSQVSDIKNIPDLVVISVPAALTEKVVEDCGKAGVKNLVVITAGFKEIGSEGLGKEKILISLCKKYSMRMMGPNCVGVMDTHTPINASFANGFPNKGNIAFISQSGAMLIAILDWSMTTGLGFSRFISLGNKAVLNEVDFIEDAGKDENTKVILCYIEDVVEGSRFMKVAKEVSKQKPIIILKSGASQAGAQAATSHTGALAGSDIAFESAFKQSGVLRARTMEELFDLAASFATQPIPKGSRVAIVTNSGGPGIITTDSIEANGLDMARFTKETISALREKLPEESSLYNPVDVLGDANDERYRFTLEKVLADENTDTVIVLLSPTAVIDPETTAKTIVEMRNYFPDKAIFAVYMGGDSLAKGIKVLSKGGVPAFTFPESAVRSIKGMVSYAQTKKILEKRKETGFSLQAIDPTKVKAIFYDVLRNRRLVLLGSEAAEVAEAYGISAAPIKLAKNPQEAVNLANEFGYPVVMKIASPKILHKTDVGGVKVGLKSEEEVREAYSLIMDSVQGFFPRTPIFGIEVQKMMPKGIEIITGISKDVQWGPLIAFGLGGIYVNLLKDVSFRLAFELSLQEIKDMLKETKAYTLLRGFRGEEPADIDAIVDCIARVTMLAIDFPEITEMDINPIFAYNKGVSALDIKITISHEFNPKVDDIEEEK